MPHPETVVRLLRGQRRRTRRQSRSASGRHSCSDSGASRTRRNRSRGPERRASRRCRVGSGCTRRSRFRAYRLAAAGFPGSQLEPSPQAGEDGLWGPPSAHPDLKCFRFHHGPQSCLRAIRPRAAAPHGPEPWSTRAPPLTDVSRLTRQATSRHLSDLDSELARQRRLAPPTVAGVLCNRLLQGPRRCAIASVEVFRWHAEPVEELSAGVGRQMLHTERLTVARITLSSGARVARHAHEHEQVATVVSGRLRFLRRRRGEYRRRSRERRDSAGRPTRSRGARRLGVLDVFSPPRDDWIRGDDAYLRR